MERWTKVKKRDKEMQMANKIRSGDIHPHLVLVQWESSNYLVQWESKQLGFVPAPPPPTTKVWGNAGGSRDCYNLSRAHIPVL